MQRFLTMSNIGAVLKGEISRVSKRATRAQLGPILQASSSQRKQLSALKKQVQHLERQVAALLRGTGKAVPVAETEEPVKFRFTAKGLRSLRRRLGLSAGEFGHLLASGWRSDHLQLGEREGLSTQGADPGHR